MTFQKIDLNEDYFRYAALGYAVVEGAIIADRLSAENKRRVVIVKPEEEAGDHVTIGVNGFSCEIKYDVFVVLPESIAIMLKNTGFLLKEA